MVPKLGEWGRAIYGERKKSPMGDGEGHLWGMGKAICDAWGGLSRGHWEGHLWGMGRSFMRDGGGHLWRDEGGNLWWYREGHLWGMRKAI